MANVKRENQLFDILGEIIQAKELTDSLLSKLLEQAWVELSGSRQKRSKDKANLSILDAIKVCKQLQERIDSNRGALRFSNTSSDEPIERKDDKRPVIQIPQSARHIGKEVSLLVGWSASDRILQKKFSEIRILSRKNGWKSNRKRIVTQTNRIVSWLEYMSKSDQFGFYPYDFISGSVNWKSVHDRVEKAAAADLLLLDQVIGGQWPDKTINAAYSKGTKSDVFFPWSLLTLRNLLIHTSPKSDREEVETALFKLYWWFGIEIDFAALKPGSKRRRVDGRDARYDPMFFWKTLNRLESLIT